MTIRAVSDCHILDPWSDDLRQPGVGWTAKNIICKSRMSYVYCVDHNILGPVHHTVVCSGRNYGLSK